MNTHTSQPITVASLKLRATLNNLSEKVGDTPMQMYTDFEASNTVPAAPMMFVYRGMDGDPNTEFDVEICLPLDATSSNYAGRFSVTTLEPFQYVERTYIGAMENMGKDGYEPLFVDMAKAQLQPDGQAREIYVNWENPASPQNETRLQVGVGLTA